MKSITVITPTPITEPQKKQYVRFMNDARDKAFLQVAHVNKDQFQKIFARGDELNAGIVKLVVQLCDWLYANEETEPKYGYFSGYIKPKPIAEQVAIIKRFFPELNGADEKLAEQSLLENAEGHFAIPRWQKVAPTYGEAVEKVFALLKKTRAGRFINYRGGKLGSNYLRLIQKIAEAFEAYGKEQEGCDILIIPAQFGLRHAGRSVRRAREVMPEREFGLDPFTIGIMLLTHPERLMDYYDLWIDCAGAEYSPGGDGVFSQTPRFFFIDDNAGFDANDVPRAIVNFGSASGFRPQIVEPCLLVD